MRLRPQRAGGAVRGSGGSPSADRERADRPVGGRAAVDLARVHIDALVRDAAVERADGVERDVAASAADLTADADDCLAGRARRVRTLDEVRVHRAVAHDPLDFERVAADADGPGGQAPVLAGAEAVLEGPEDHTLAVGGRREVVEDDVAAAAVDPCRRSEQRLAEWAAHGHALCRLGVADAGRLDDHASGRREGADRAGGDAPAVERADGKLAPEGARALQGLLLDQLLERGDGGEVVRVGAEWGDAAAGADQHLALRAGGEDALLIDGIGRALAFGHLHAVDGGGDLRGCRGREDAGERQQRDEGREQARTTARPVTRWTRTVHGGPPSVGEGNDMGEERGNVKSRAPDGAAATTPGRRHRPGAAADSGGTGAAARRRRWGGGGRSRPA